MNNRLDLYKAALKTAWGFNDYNDWPIRYNSIMHLFIEEFTTEFLNDLETFKNKFGIEELGKRFYNPARIFRIINSLIYGMKRLRMDISLQRSIVIDLLDVVRSMKYGSEFNEDNRNIILSPEQISNIQLSKRFIRADERAQKIIQKFCGIIWAYTEAICFRGHDVTKEIHGPYTDNLIIREYLNLNPSDIWINVPLLSVNSVTIYTFYSKNLNINIDPYNHLFHVGGNFKDDLLSFCIDIDGEKADITDLENLMRQAIKTISTINAWVDAGNWRDITNRYADIYWYKKRPLSDSLNKCWRVPEQVRNNIRNGNINETKKNNLSITQIDRLITTII